MNREQKADRVAELQRRFDAAKLLFLTDFKSMTVAEMTDLRARIKEAKAEYQVAKNTLVRLAAKGRPAEKLTEHLVGPNGLITADEDVVAPAKALQEFTKINKKLVLKVGLLDGRLITADDLKALASLPGREVLLAQVLGALNSVPAGFVGVLAAVLRNFLGVLKAIETEKSKAA